MNKKALTETDIRTKFITPALVGPDGEKWNVMTQIREEASRVTTANLISALVAELTAPKTLLGSGPQNGRLSPSKP